MIHTARVTYSDDSTEYLFASLDGTLFIGVNRLPTSEPEDAIAIERLFKVGVNRTLPMRVHRNLLDQYGAVFGRIG